MGLFRQFLLRASSYAAGSCGSSLAQRPKRLALSYMSPIRNLLCLNARYIKFAFQGRPVIFESPRHKHPKTYDPEREGGFHPHRCKWQNKDDINDKLWIKLQRLQYVRGDHLKLLNTVLMYFQWTQKRILTRQMQIVTVQMASMEYMDAQIFFTFHKRE